MIANLVEEFDKHLKWAKEKKDHMAFAFALEEEVKNKENSKKFNKFRKEPIYKEIFLKSLKRFREIVEDEKKDIVKYGYGSSEHFVDKNFHLSNKYRLKLLEKEAKRLKL